MRATRLALFAAALAMVLPALVAFPAGAQAPSADLYSFSLKPEGDTRTEVPVNGQSTIRLVWDDLSRDGYSGYVPPGTPATPPANLQPHSVSFTVEPVVDDPGWFVPSISGFTSYSGMHQVVDVLVQSYAQAKHPSFKFNVTAHASTNYNGTYAVSVALVAHSLGPGSFAAQVSKSYLLRPNQIADIDVRLVNLAIRPRQFDMEVTDNPCHMAVATTNNNLVPGKGEATYSVSIQTPAKKPWYFSQLCTLAIQVNPSGDPQSIQTAYASVQVNGGYIDPPWVFNTLFILLLLFLLFLFLARRKARVEEEILGKPQKPWTIPVEALYLKALRQKDERAWYVVRHYLMEDEYRSALLWYRAYKKSTRGDRKKERLVVVQERGYERWKAAWRKDIDRPLRKADRYEAQLQRKLDRKVRKAHRKQMGKYRKVMRKMEAAHAKQVERAGNKHAKEAARAAKKGLPAPKRPVVPQPDYPEEPQPVPIALAEHKWSKKAAKFRARMVRKQGDLEVKFEKADARRLRKVRRKVHKLARKLDDPEFVKEHPLLQGS